MRTQFLLALFTLLFGFGAGAGSSTQPPYQVALYMRLHPKGAPLHLCNGAIVQSRLVVTSASCVHYKFLPHSPPFALDPSLITVVAGSASALSDTISASVNAITVLDNFNITTLENDLALLRLSSSLPLATRADMKWIILNDDENLQDKSCLANFYQRQLMDTYPDYTQTEELFISTQAACRNLTKYTTARKNDICSTYVLPIGFDCDELNDLIRYSGDRGTALVCNSRLAAVLSTILPLPNEDDVNCSELPVKSFYTNLRPHLNWIYDIIAAEEYIDIMQDNFAFSTPYQQESGAIMQSSVAATSTTKSVVRDSTTTTAATTDDGASNRLDVAPSTDYFHASAGQRLHFTQRSCLLGILALICLSFVA